MQQQFKLEPQSPGQHVQQMYQLPHSPNLPSYPPRISTPVDTKGKSRET